MKPFHVLLSIAALSGSLTVAAAAAETVVVDVDSAYPSGGSGYPLIFSAGGTAEVELATTDPGPAPVARQGPLLTPSPAPPTSTPS